LAGGRWQAFQVWVVRTYSRQLRFNKELSLIKRKILAEEAQGFRQPPTTKPKAELLTIGTAFR
jgi:hypothetical protein